MGACAAVLAFAHPSMAQSEDDQVACVAAFYLAWNFVHICEGRQLADPACVLSHTNDYADDTTAFNVRAAKIGNWTAAYEKARGYPQDLTDAAFCELANQEVRDGTIIGKLIEGP